MDKLPSPAMRRGGRTRVSSSCGCRPLEAVALGARSGGAGDHRVVSMDGFLAGGHEDLDAHPVGAGGGGTL